MEVDRCRRHDDRARNPEGAVSFKPVAGKSTAPTPARDDGSEPRVLATVVDRGFNRVFQEHERDPDWRTSWRAQKCSRLSPGRWLARNERSRRSATRRPTVRSPPWTTGSERLTRFERSPRSGRRRSPLASHPQLALEPTTCTGRSRVVDGQWSSAAGVEQVRRTDATVGAGVP